MFIFHYRQQMSLALRCAQTIAIFQQVATFSHNTSFLPQIPTSAPPSLADCGIGCLFSITSSISLLFALMVLVFVSFVYICIDMPYTFCGWISILVYIYIGLPLCKARKWGSHNKDLHKVLHVYSTILLCKAKKWKVTK
jgi:hypothetical protein